MTQIPCPTAVLLTEVRARELARTKACKDHAEEQTGTQREAWLAAADRHGSIAAEAGALYARQCGVCDEVGMVALQRGVRHTCPVEEMAHSFDRRTHYIE